MGLGLRSKGWGGWRLLGICAHSLIGSHSRPNPHFCITPFTPLALLAQPSPPFTTTTHLGSSRAHPLQMRRVGFTMYAATTTFTVKSVAIFSSSTRAMVQGGMGEWAQQQGGSEGEECLVREGCEVGLVREGGRAGGRCRGGLGRRR